MTVPLRPFLVLLAIVLGFSVGMATLLNYFKFESALRKHESARFNLVADDVQNNIELSLGMGFAFGEIGTLQDLIERHRGSDKLILSLHVIDAAGRVRYSTDAQQAGQSAPAAWIAALRRPEWLLSEPEALVAGKTVRNAFDVVVGAVAVRYDRRQSDAAVKELRVSLTALAALIIAVLLLVGAALLYLLARMTERALHRAADALLDPASNANGSTLLAETLAFRNSAERIERELDAMAAELAPAARQHKP